MRAGIAVALLFPGVFVFSSEESMSNILIRFFATFVFILSVWVVTFSLVDFRSRSRTVQARHAHYFYMPLSFLCAIVIYMIVATTLDQTGRMLEPVTGDLSHSSRAWLFLCLRIVIFNALIILIKFLFDNSKEKQEILMENETLKRENLNALHESLKQQVNPHFLFNSLNTLKSLIKEDQGQAVDFTSELSSVYRYMLRHQDKKEVPLKEEIGFVKSYLYLLKIRYGDAIQVKIDIPEELLDSLMPPNTLQLLMENTVKHNALSGKKPLSISIYIHDGHLVVENTLHPKTARGSSSQLGLSNIQGRYALLKGKEVVIQRSDEFFRVLLPI